MQEKKLHVWVISLVWSRRGSSPGFFFVYFCIFREISADGFCVWELENVRFEWQRSGPEPLWDPQLCVPHDAGESVGDSDAWLVFQHTRHLPADATFQT